MAVSQNQLRRIMEAKLKKFANLNKVRRGDLQILGDDLIRLMKENISKGISPIEGEGRFPAYKNPDRYPKNVRKRFPSKRRRPVNLFLSGKFLSKLTKRVREGMVISIQIGFFDNESKLKERGHRDGAGGQPKRPIIPKKGEFFTNRIIIEWKKRIISVINKNIKQR